MFTRRLTICTILGFPIKIDATWIFLAVLVTWSLADGIFPKEIPGLTVASYWVMGVFGALGLFASILFHELGHAVVARRHGIEIRDITLFIFGGVAQMATEPPDAKSEFRMAVAGPIASMILALALYGIAVPLGAGGLGAGGEAASLTGSVVQYLGWMNGMLALFNILPAFPLDGGRMLRAALWSLRGDLKWATRIASIGGSTFGLFLIAMGVFAFISGAILPGLWWFMIGMFVRAASRASYQQVLFKRALEGETVGRFMRADPVTIPPGESIESLVENFIYHHHFKMMPVSENGRLLGCVTIRGVKTVPRDEWAAHSVGEIMVDCSDENSISPDADATDALAVMNRSKNIRLMVVDQGDLVGVITLKDLLEFLAMKMDLEGDSL